MHSKKEIPSQQALEDEVFKEEQKNREKKEKPQKQL